MGYDKLTGLPVWRAAGLYAAHREHAGCILWAAPGGDLYLQLSGGGYARACPEPG